MIRIFLYLTSIAILQLSCNQEIKLSKEKYVDIILDLQVAETVINNSKLGNKDSMRRAYHLRICEIYGFKDIESLKKSLQPLEQNPQLMLDITKEMSRKLDELADSSLSLPANPPE